MAKKIEGYCQQHDNQDYLDRGNTVYVNRSPCTGKDPRCTVVVHKGKSERVFTESEVRAYGDDLLSAHMSPGQIVDRADDYDEPLYLWIDRAIKAVNAQHGISDPA